MFPTLDRIVSKGVDIMYHFTEQVLVYSVLITKDVAFKSQNISHCNYWCISATTDVDQVDLILNVESYWTKLLSWYITGDQINNELVRTSSGPFY